ncbi:MAG: phosphate/phosphite/phosphonate ABC transporter substrate-binding protein [Deltaproteobacteria bacterium]|jgi:phosphonate transport system substrate-binding protein
MFKKFGLPGRSHSDERELVSLIFRATVIAVVFLALVAGCDDRPESPPPATQAQIRTLRIGLLPELNLFGQKKKYEPLANYLAGKTGAGIELVVLPRYGNITESFTAEKLDGAFLGSFTGAQAVAKLGLEPLARPEYKDGITTSYGMILVRKDSGISTGADMKGKRFAFVDEGSTAGWLFPLHFFKVSGIADYRSWFCETYFAGTHEDVIRDVLSGMADVGAAKNTIFNRMRENDDRFAEKLEVLAVSPPFPSDPFAIRADLEPPLKAGLKKALLQMDQNKEGRRILEAFGAARFIKPTAEDDRAAFAYAREVERGQGLLAHDHPNQ